MADWIISSFTGRAKYRIVQLDNIMVENNPHRSKVKKEKVRKRTTNEFDVASKRRTRLQFNTVEISLLVHGLIKRVGITRTGQPAHMQRRKKKLRKKEKCAGRTMSDNINVLGPRLNQ